MRIPRPRIVSDRTGAHRDTTNGQFVSKRNNGFYQDGVADGRRQERARLILEMEQRPALGLLTTCLPRLHRATRIPFDTTTTARMAKEIRRKSANELSCLTPQPSQTSRLGVVLQILGLKRPE
jgi:hypothetical protein